MLALLNTPLVIGQGQLAWLEPLVGLSSGILGGAMWLAVILAIVFFSAPATALLAGSRSGSWYRRAPYLWTLPLFLGLAMLPFANVENISWGTLTVLPYLVWAAFVNFVGIIQGVFRTARFIWNPRAELSQWDVAFRKTVYGVGALLSGGIMLMGALIDGQLFLGLYGGFVSTVGIVVLATGHQEVRDRWLFADRRDRLRRAIGSIGLALFAPPVVASVLVEIVGLLQDPSAMHLGLTNGRFLTLFLLVLTIPAAYLFRSSGIDSKRRSQEPDAEDPAPALEAAT